MKYENTKSKLRRIWTQSNINKYEITNQQDAVKRLKKNNESSHIMASKTPIDLSTGWVLMTPASRDSDISAWYADYVMQWDIDLKEMPIKLIPFIKYQVIYKILGEEDFTANGLAVTLPRIPVIFRLEDIEDSSGGVIGGIKKVTMLVGYALRPAPFNNLDRDYDIQAKLIIKLYNPELII